MTVTLVSAAYKRPWYFGRQLDAWLRVRGLDQVDKFLVTIGDSDRMGGQVAELDRFAGQVPFEVRWIVDSPPRGPHAAIGWIMARAFDEGAGFVFFTDEDILPADDLLELVAWARDKFAVQPHVLTVNAHSECGQGWDGPYVRDDPDADPAVVRLKPYHNQWGWGTWADRWRTVLAPEWDWDGRHRGCDWNIQRLLTERHLLAVTPDASRTEHIGHRDGMFSNAQTLAFSDAASFREHREPVEFRIEDQ